MNAGGLVDQVPCKIVILASILLPLCFFVEVLCEDQIVWEHHGFVCRDELFPPLEAPLIDLSADEEASENRQPHSAPQVVNSGLLFKSVHFFERDSFLDLEAADSLVFA